MTIPRSRNWRSLFKILAEIEFTDKHKNNGCTDKEVLGLQDIFKYCAKNLTLSDARMAVFDLVDFYKSEERCIANFTLTINRQRIDKTNRLCDDTEDFDIYDGTFTHKTNDTSITMKAIALLMPPN